MSSFLAPTDTRLGITVDKTLKFCLVPDFGDDVFRRLHKVWLDCCQSSQSGLCQEIRYDQTKTVQKNQVEILPCTIRLAGDDSRTPTRFSATQTNLPWSDFRTWPINSDPLLNCCTLPKPARITCCSLRQDTRGGGFPLGARQWKIACSPAGSCKSCGSSWKFSLSTGRRNERREKKRKI